MVMATVSESGNMSLISGSLIVLLLFFQLSNHVDCLAEDGPESEFCQKFVRSKGYLCEEHKMYTEDGFELVLHRVRIPAESEHVSDTKHGDIQYNLKAALGQRFRKKDKPKFSRKTSEVKVADSNGNSEVVFTDDFVSQPEKAQPFKPYELVKKESDSGSDHRQQGPRRLRWPRSSDARDLPENLPLQLPPLSSVEDPTVFVDPQSSSAQPLSGSPSNAALSDGPQEQATLETFAPTLLPTTLARNPFNTFQPVQQTPLSAEIPTATPISFQPGETQPLSPEASTVALPPLWYIPGVAQPPVQSEPSDLPGPSLPADPVAAILSPELPPDLVTPEAVSPAPSGPEIPGQRPEPSDQPPYPGQVVPGDLPLVDPQSPSPIEWVEPPSAPDKSVSEIIAAAPSERHKRCRAVLLLHHELLNGDMWFTEVNGKGPNPLLPFLLADDGFDVWLGHERATYWSHDHARLESSDLEYWNWTWDEFVDDDLPIMLNHISTNTHSKVHVVGVSQSAAVAVAASAQQAVAALMKSLVLVGPSIYHGSVGPQQLQTWAQLFAKFLDITQPDPSLFLGQFNISRNFAMHNWSMGGPASMITGPDCCISRPLTLFGNGWDGITSYKNFQHFEQGFLTNTFQRYDFGSTSRNLEAYGQTTPPAYSPGNIPVDLPVQVIYGGNDFLSPVQGIEELAVAMPKLPLKVYLPLYAHFDLFYSSSRYQDVYFPILSFLRESGLV